MLKKIVYKYRVSQKVAETLNSCKPKKWRTNLHALYEQEKLNKKCRYESTMNTIP